MGKGVAEVVFVSVELPVKVGLVLGGFGLAVVGAESCGLQFVSVAAVAPLGFEVFEFV